MRLVQSEPILVSDATFAAVVQAEWQRPEKAKLYGTLAITQVDLQLLLTNHKKGNVVFPIHGTLAIKLFGKDGKEIAARLEKKGTVAAGPVVLPEGGSYALYQRADVSLNGDAAEFSFFDSSGAHSIIGPLKPGTYKLVCSYAVTAEQTAKVKVKGAQTWTGKVVTKEVTVKLLPDTIRGYAREMFADYRRPGTEVMWVAASKPVLKNDARFTVVAQRDWKLSKDKKDSIPVDIQLHIANVGKNDLIFGTFDAFEVFLKDIKGKKVDVNGGRDGTRFTKPLWIPAGATYAICRKAELSWDKETKGPMLNYWDGTGSWAGYSPLSSGLYDVSFGYWGRPIWNIKELEPKRRDGDPALWAGAVVTENARVEVLQP
jgi:hypothetical protein